MSHTWSATMPAALRPYVARAVGYAFSGMPAGAHVGAPSGYLTLIVAVGDPIVVSDPGAEPQEYDALVAGMQATPSLVHHDGHMAGVQLDLTPAGARALLGVPAGALNGAVDLDELLLPGDRGLAARVTEADGPRRRMRLVLEAVTRRLADHATAVPPPEVTEAWQLLHRTCGTVPVRQVAEVVGWSPRHLGQRFRAETGVSPKTLGRVARFQRARSHLLQGEPPAEVAARCGYADQAHLSREWRELCGTPPATWLRTDHLAVSGADLGR